MIVVILGSYLGYVPYVAPDHPTVSSEKDIEEFDRKVMEFTSFLPKETKIYE